VCEAGLPASLTKSVEGKPYEAGENLSTKVEENVGSFSENPATYLTELSTIGDSIGVDSDVTIDDLMETFRAGGKVTW